MRFPISKHTHYWLSKLERGCEIGASAHNPLGLPGVINVDYTDDMDTIFKREEIRLCGEAVPVDVVDEGDSLATFADSSLDFIYSSHVVEHFPNFFGALLAWRRVLKPGGIIYMIVPKRDALKEDAVLPLTTYDHMIEDFVAARTVETHEVEPGHGVRGHYHRFTPFGLAEFVDRFGLHHAESSCEFAATPSFKVVDIEETDSKVGNGFTLVIRSYK